MKESAVNSDKTYDLNPSVVLIKYDCRMQHKTCYPNASLHSCAKTWKALQMEPLLLNQMDHH